MGEDEWVIYGLNIRNWRRQKRWKKLVKKLKLIKKKKKKIKMKMKKKKKKKKKKKIMPLLILKEMNGN